MKDTLKYSLVLFLICFIAGILLSTIYAVTSPLIQKARAQQEESAISEVLPEARRTQEIQKEDLVYYAALDEKRNLLGYIFSCEAKGYSSIIRAVVSVEPDGKIIAIKVLEQNETPGVGSRISEEDFFKKFKHKTKKDTIDAISGATISSSALINSVKETLQKIFP